MSPNPDKLSWWETTKTKVIVVILAVIGFFLLLPRLSGRIGPAKIAQAKTEIQNLFAAINQYETVYNSFPFPQHLPVTNPPANFTFGTFGTSASKFGITNANGLQANNSAVIAALLDLTNFANGNATPNSNHILNPQKLVFLNAHMSSNTNSPGIGTDGVFRDPWGNPYIITINLKGRTNCLDAFYRLASVSELDSGQIGINGLSRATPPPYTNADARDSFSAPTTIMVWSLGPDGKANQSQKANQGVNKDNITSW